MSEEANKKWSMRNRMVTWPMMSRDIERSRSWHHYASGLVSRKQLEMLFSYNRYLLDSLLWGSMVHYISDSLASYYFTLRHCGKTAKSWPIVEILSLPGSPSYYSQNWSARSEIRAGSAWMSTSKYRWCVNRNGTTVTVAIVSISRVRITGKVRSIRS